MSTHQIDADDFRNLKVSKEIAGDFSPPDVNKFLFVVSIGLQSHYELFSTNGGKQKFSDIDSAVAAYNVA